MRKINLQNYPAPLTGYQRWQLFDTVPSDMQVYAMPKYRVGLYRDNQRLCYVYVTDESKIVRTEILQGDENEKLTATEYQQILKNFQQNISDYQTKIKQIIDKNFPKITDTITLENTTLLTYLIAQQKKLGATKLESNKEYKLSGITIGDEKASVNLSHPIDFITLSQPDQLSEEQKKQLKALIEQHLAEPKNGQNNKFRLLPDTVYKITVEDQPQFVVLSHEIQQITNIDNQKFYPILQPNPIRVEIKKDKKSAIMEKRKILLEQKKQPKFTVIKRPPLGFVSLYDETALHKSTLTPEVIPVTEEDLDCVISNSLGGFAINENNINYEKKPHIIKSYLQNDDDDIFNIKKIRREQKLNNKAFEKDFETTVIEQGARITELRVAMPTVPGSYRLGVYGENFTLNYGECLTIAMETTAALRQLYQRFGHHDKNAKKYIHGDLHWKNMLYDPKNRSIGIFDFDGSQKVNAFRNPFGMEGFSENLTLAIQMRDEHANILGKTMYAEMCDWLFYKKERVSYEETEIKEKIEKINSFIKENTQKSPTLKLSLQILFVHFYQARKLIKEGLQNNQNAEQKFQQAMESIQFLQEQYQSSILFPKQYKSDKLMSAQQIMEIERFIISSHGMGETDYKNLHILLNKIIYEVKNKSNQLAMKFEDSNSKPTELLQKLRSFIKENLMISLPEGVIDDDQQLFLFCKNYGVYRDINSRFVKEELLLSQDTAQLGVGLEKLHTTPSSTENSEYFSTSGEKTFTTKIEELKQKKITTIEQLDNTQLNFCYLLLEQLFRDCRNIKNTLREDCKEIAKSKSRYEKESEKYKAYDVLESTYKQKRKELEELKKEIINLRKEYVQEKNEENKNVQLSLLLNKSLEDLLTKTRELQKKYDSCYEAISTATNNAEKFLGERRLGFKSVAAVVTRPLSLVLGKVRRLFNADKYNWYDKGFFCTRSHSAQQLQKIQDHLAKTAQQLQTLSPALKTQ